MSKSPLRKDKTCLNCNYVVENRFCPNCGQENIDPRKTFYHLFVHFFEDLTHYENAFWKTIRNLLFKPASLTKEYLSGKRLSYLAPIRLYIFISFITFFLISAYPDNKSGIFDINTTSSIEPATKNNSSHEIKKDSDSHRENDPEQTIPFPKKKDSTEKSLNPEKDKKTNDITPNEYASKNDIDSIQKQVKESKRKEEDLKEILNFTIKSVRQLDSIQKFGNEKEKFTPIEYWIAKKVITITDNNSTEEILKKIKESFIHNLPKVLLLYMPLFAFFLWSFHGKKRWYYFDHGIFTLHYFSFLLLINLIIFIANTVFSLFGDTGVTSFLIFIADSAGFIWMFYYFFPAHHRFYGETRIISFIKTSILFFINMFFIFIMLLLFLAYTFINLH